MSTCLKIGVIGLPNSIHTEKMLKGLSDRGHDVHLFSTQRCSSGNVTFHDITSLSDSRGRVRRLVTLSLHTHQCRNIRRLFGFRQLLERLRPDILYSYTLLNENSGYLGVFSGYHPFVVTPLDGDVLWSCDPGWRAKRTLRHELFLRYVARKADALTASTKVMREGWIRLGADPDKITMVVDPGTETDYFYPRGRENEIRKELQLGSSPVVLSTRSLGSIYNIDVIIKAIPLVLKKVPDAKFVLIYHSSSETELIGLKALVAELGIGDSVIFAGTVSDYYNDVPKYFSMADVFVSLSSHDTVPNSLLEAMACGAPPVCARLPAIDEYIKDGWNGFVVRQRDHVAASEAITRLLTDKSLGKMFGERNLSIVKQRAEFKKQMETLESAFLGLTSS